MGRELGGLAENARHVRLAGGIERRIKPRVLSSPRRLSDNFVKYVERLIVRLEPGAGRVRIKACLHDGSVTKVGHRVLGLFPPPPKNRRGGPAAPLPQELRRALTSVGASPERIVATLWLRLSRLLRHCVVRYGKIVIDIVDGRITSIQWTQKYVPGLDSPQVLEGLFAGAPESFWAAHPWGV